jgi:hypothetical protein
MLRRDYPTSAPPSGFARMFRRALSLVALLLAAGQSGVVEASCGDYLSHPASASSSVTLDGAPGPASPLPDLPTCRDGSCHDGYPPVAPDAPRLRLHNDRWAVAGGLKAASELTGPAGRIAEAVSRTSPALDGLFRPPEAG